MIRLSVFAVAAYLPASYLFLFLVLLLLSISHFSRLFPVRALPSSACLCLPIYPNAAQTGRQKILGRTLVTRIGRSLVIGPAPSPNPSISTAPCLSPPCGTRPPPRSAPAPTSPRSMLKAISCCHAPSRFTCRIVSPIFVAVNVPVLVDLAIVIAPCPQCPIVGRHTLILVNTANLLHDPLISNFARFCLSTCPMVTLESIAL